MEILPILFMASLAFIITVDCLNNLPEEDVSNLDLSLTLGRSSQTAPRRQPAQPQYPPSTRQPAQPQYPAPTRQPAQPQNPAPIRQPAQPQNPAPTRQPAQPQYPAPPQNPALFWHLPEEPQHVIRQQTDSGERLRYVHVPVLSAKRKPSDGASGSTANPPAGQGQISSTAHARAGQGQTTNTAHARAVPSQSRKEPVKRRRYRSSYTTPSDFIANQHGQMMQLPRDKSAAAQPIPFVSNVKGNYFEFRPELENKNKTADTRNYFH